MTEPPADRPEPIFHADGDLLVPTANAVGPWFPGVLHGGAVAAVSLRAVERLPSAVPMQPARWTLDLSRRVPHGPIRVRAEVLRDGRRLQSVAVDVVHDGEVVARATVLRLRTGDGVVPDDVLPEPWPEDAPPPPPEAGEPHVLQGEAFSYVRCFETRRIGVVGGGRGAAWYRFRTAVVDDEPVSPAVRVAATADMVMSAGSIVGFDRFTAANPDLSVHLQRLPEGPWLCIDSVARVDGRGIGQSEAVLSDRTGRIGRSCKSVLVDRR